jgi:glycosyltransferase involved in cell wall biosynthesis
VLIPDGVDFDRYQNISPAPKELLGFTTDCTVIGQVAALVDHKDQSTFLEAMARIKERFPRVRAVIVGEGGHRKMLEAKIISLKLQDVVRLLGFRKDALRYLAAFDVFCLSSKEEGLGTSILDAMALRIPVVATAAGGIPEMVQDQVTGYLATPSDPESLANALTQAILAKNSNQALIARAYQKAQEFEILHTVSKTEFLYESTLVNLKRRQPSGLLNEPWSVSVKDRSIENPINEKL